MDNLKSMVLDFIHTKGQHKIPLVGGTVDFIEDNSNENVVKVEIRETEQPSDQEILDSIDKIYYSTNNDFDPSRFILQKFDTLEDVEELEQSLRCLRQQHSVVSNQVLQMILEKQSASLQELERVAELEKALNEARETVSIGRRSLAFAATHITTSSLAILTNSRKRSRLKKLLNSLVSVATLKETERQGESRLSCGDLTGAIRLIVECLRAAGSFRHFTCVNGLTAKLQDTLVMAEEHLDQTTANVCYSFNEKVYSQIESAYSVLGKGQAALDQLLMHFTSAIHNSAYTTVQKFVSQSESTKPDYPQLCKLVSEESFIECLTSLCKALWAILLSYHQLITWHFAKINNSSPGSKFENSYYEEYSRQKLEGGRSRLWHDVQSRVSLLVLSTSLASYKFDDFLHFLAILYRLSQIGEELCGGELGRHGDELASSIRTQSQDYFSKYHLARLGDLSEILDHEPWTVCPIKRHFNLLHLQEWRGLRWVVEKCAGVNKSHSGSDASSFGSGPGFFSQYPSPSVATPFDKTYLTSSIDESILPEEVDRKEYSSEESDDENSSKSGNILIGNTTLTVLRLCGKYLQMAKYLESIVEDVVSSVCQLFEYYLYSVHAIFSAESSMSSYWWHVGPTIKLQAVLKRIKETLLFDNDRTFSNIQSLEPETDFYGLEAKVVGIESLVFLSEQYHLLRPYLEKLLSNQNSSLHKLNHFYTQTVAVSTEVRGPVYWCVAMKVINGPNIISAMGKVDWELKDVMSQHSTYVDTIISELEDFSSRLEKIKIGGDTPLPKPVIDSLWDSICFLTANLFVEGFSSSRKCSNGGRALMQLDWAQLLCKLSRLCPLRPIPHTPFVENYIKAYYQPESDLLNWIKSHYTEYSGKQLVALVCSACQTDRKSRLRLTAVLEELTSEQSFPLVVHR